MISSVSWCFSWRPVTTWMARPARYKRDAKKNAPRGVFYWLTSSDAFGLAAFFDQFQALVVVVTDALVQLRIGFQFLFPSREDFGQLGSPFATGFFREAALDQFQHDRYGYRCTWRSAKQCSQRAVFRGNQFGAELQHAAFFRVFLDDLHTLTSHFQTPVFGLGL